MFRSFATVLPLVAQVALGCDLRPDVATLRDTFVVDTVEAGRDQCLINENCLSGPGTRTVLRFESKLWNQGSSDCTIGWTPACPQDLTAPQPLQFPFQYDTCHKHWHFTGLAEYFLYDMYGNMVSNGAKNGLCMMDSQDCPTGKFGCESQGISSGCWDSYERSLDCQWIDITGLDENRAFDFVWRVNAGRTIQESNFANNEARVRIVPADLPHFYAGDGQVVNQCREARRGRGVERWTEYTGVTERWRD